MNYIKDFIQLLTQYDYILLPCISGALFLFCIVNFCKNVYRKQNRKIISVTRKICSYPHKAAQYANGLPQEYQRQWRTYVNSNADQPSLVFEFAPIKNRLLFVRLLIIAAMASSCFIAAFVFDTSRIDYLIFQIVFWLAFTLVLVTSKLIHKCRERKAKKIFARLINELNRSLTKEQTKQAQFDETVSQLHQLQKCKPTNAVFERASELLHSKGLDGERSIDDQRKLNGALNGLLQSYTHAN